MLKRIAGILTLGMAVLGAVLLLAQPAPAAPPRRPLFPWEFAEVAPQGFGDRQNNAVWSMQWWNGELYVGTVRAWFCWTWAWVHMQFPYLPYPPDDPDTECAPDLPDLPLQAEIWRYTPETETWERVYQSPNDMEIPTHPGEYTARDIGYRGMVVFREPDGTEALYVGGATSNLLWPPMPPPRILRSTDGIAFEPIPQDSGTVLGDLGTKQTSFRGMVVYKGRLYVLIGEIKGQGAVLEADNPAGGNDNFRWITPQDMQVFEVAPFNGFLYLGLADPRRGYAVVKTDATGTPPYTFTPVVADGGFRRPRPSSSVISMFVFKGRLYLGTDNPTELIRINPDDTWDLVVGSPRETPDGWKYPLSGMDTGFDWPLNQHIWRMQEQEGVLYVATLDMSTRWRGMPGMDERIGDRYGFDLYRTSDGQYFSPITVNGFGDKFQNGIRTLASTPHGLFLGTSSFWYGLRIWQGTRGEVYTVYLPLLVKSDGSMAVAKGSSTSSPVVPSLSHTTPSLKPPERLEVESKNGVVVVLSWERPPGVTRFRIFRSEFASNRVLRIPNLHSDAWIPGPFAEIGTTDEFVFVDSAVRADRPYQYYVLAEDEAGTASLPSNLVRAPSLAATVTFKSLTRTLDEWLNLGELEPGSAADIASVLEEAHGDVSAGDLARAVKHLGQLSQSVERGQVTGLDRWRAEDLEILLAKLTRRVRLVQAGIIAPSDLD